MKDKIINDMKRGDVANVIVFYEFEEKEESIEGWLRYCMQWLQDHGLVPTLAGVTGEGFGGKKNITFKNAFRRLEKGDFKNIKALSFSATRSRDEYLDDGFLVVYFTLTHKRTFLIYWDDKIVPFSRPYCHQLIKDLSCFLKPKYGYCFQRLFKHGPLWYPFGIGSGNISDQESRELSNWGLKYRKEEYCKTGDFRDIYPLNILSQPHLDRMIDNQRLEDWILSDAQRGELEKLEDDLWSWWIPKENILSVRNALAPTGLLISLQRHPHP